ncbi:MAG: pyrroloquinoline quinone precursor peptide PqqA [Geminicoccaceae bacterium]
MTKKSWQAPKVETTPVSMEVTMYLPARARQHVDAVGGSSRHARASWVRPPAAASPVECERRRLSTRTRR